MNGRNIVVRQNRATLAETMKTAREVSNRWELWELILANTVLPPLVVRAGTSALQITPYGYDARIGRNTFLITIPGYGVWGMADGDIP